MRTFLICLALASANVFAADTVKLPEPKSISEIMNEVFAQALKAIKRPNILIDADINVDSDQNVSVERLKDHVQVKLTKDIKVDPTKNASGPIASVTPDVVVKTNGLVFTLDGDTVQTPDGSTQTTQTITFSKVEGNKLVPAVLKVAVDSEALSLLELEFKQIVFVIDGLQPASQQLVANVDCKASQSAVDVITDKVSMVPVKCSLQGVYDKKTGKYNLSIHFNSINGN